MRQWAATLLLLTALGVSAPAATAEKEKAAPPGVEETTQQALRGNAQSRIYHNASCRYYNCKACTVRLSSPAEARAKGFRACKVCGG